MDGVLADFNGYIRSFIHPDKHKPDVNFYITDTYPKLKPMIHKLCAQPGFFFNLPLIEGAIDGWARLLALDYEPVICSSPLHSNKTCREDKLAWLEHHFVPYFGISIVDQAWIIKDKSLAEGDVLIDDRVVWKTLSTHPTWKQLLFKQPYNKHSELPQLDGWFDPKLPELLKELTQ